MAILVSRQWEATFASGLSRRERRGCTYEAYVPDPLVGRRFVLDGDVAADVADAEAAIARLNLEATTIADSEAFARLLLRAEAVASSRIEGLELGGRRLLRAEAARALGDDSRDITAEEVLGNIEAMNWAAQLAPERPLAPSDLLEVHRRLLAGTRLRATGGVVRAEQNWIGGTRFNPCGAAFVPPPPEDVPRLLEDLCQFCNDDSLPAVVQAAIAHAQFETIHPFADGNGRTGRALIHMVLRRRGLAPRTAPPVSLVLATWAQEYVAALSATRYVGDSNSPAAHDGLNHWIALFATACRRAVADVAEYESRIRGLQAEWRLRLGPVRGGSATQRLLLALPGMPILTVSGAAERIRRSFQATNEAVERLRSAAVLVPISVGRRNRAFEAAELIDSFIDLERQLASPDAGTHFSPPSRATPKRPSREDPRRI